MLSDVLGVPSSDKHVFHSPPTPFLVLSLQPLNEHMKREQENRNAYRHTPTSPASTLVFSFSLIPTVAFLILTTLLSKHGSCSSSSNDCIAGAFFHWLCDL